MKQRRDIYKHIKIKPFDRQKYREVLNLVKDSNLHTVCMEANCPNRYECFSQNTATFLIMGDICTRNCQYCNVSGGIPGPLDPAEPVNIRRAVEKMRLKYAVITCVTRDDLPDGGAGHFVKVVHEIKKIGDCQVELLISDLKGNLKALKQIVDSEPDVLNHNIEVVRDIFPRLRPRGNYQTSLDILKHAKTLRPDLATKSGLMVGLGETWEQILSTFSDLLEVKCTMLTVGQYLQPTPAHAPIEKFYSQEEFRKLKKIALEMGFQQVEAGTLIRSSYHAREMTKES
jgi:lipoic acid synthetase